MSLEFSLPAYLARINVVTNESLAPTKETLALIQISHLRSVTFENLDVVQKKIISPKIDDIYAKIMNSKRGGYCFETNSLLAEGLTALGFKVRKVLARSKWNHPAR